MSDLSKRAGTEPGWTPESDESDFAGVFIPVPVSLDVHLPRRGPHDDSPSHITFLVIGNVAPELRATVLDILREELVAVLPPVHVEANDLGYFTNDKGEVIAHLVPKFSRDLTTVRQQIVRRLEESGVDVADKGKDVWKPHLTLAYLPEGSAHEYESPEVDVAWSFAEMELWGFPERHRLPLGDTLGKVAGEEDVPFDIREVLERARLEDGENPLTGTVPVTEEVFDVLLEPQPQPEQVRLVAYSLYSEADQEKALSKLPVEALHALLSRHYRGRWWAQEPEVILEDLFKLYGFDLDPGGINRVRALHAICSAPVGNCPFYDDPEAFRFLTLCLSGRAVRADTDAYPSPFEMCLAVLVVQPVRPGLFSHEVKAFMAAVSFWRKHWVLPSVLEVAQEHLIRMCANLDIPVDEARVARVRTLAQAERDSGGKAIPDTVRDDDDVQALRLIDIEDALEAALARGDSLADKVETAWTSGVDDGQ